MLLFDRRTRRSRFFNTIRKIKKNILFFVLVLLCHSLRAQQLQLKFSYLTVDNGLSHTDAKDIKQDRKGFIWIATLFGLDRYDGYSIKRFYNSTDSLNNGFNNRIRTLHIENDNRIWLGGDYGVGCFDPVQGKFLKISYITHDRKPDSCLQLQMLPGNILAGMFRDKLKLFHISGTVLSEIKVTYPEDVSFSGIAVDKNKNLFASSNRGIWMLKEGRELKKLRFTGGNTAISYSGIYFNRHDDMILLANSHVFLIDQQQNGRHYDAEVLKVSKLNTLPGNAHSVDILQDNKDHYWVCTEKGLYYLDNELNLKSITTSKSYSGSINTNYLSKVFIDRTECLWLCTYGGGVDFCDLNKKAFYTFKHNPEDKNSLSGDHIRSLLEDGKNRIYIGTHENGLNSYNFLTKKFIEYNTTTSPIKLKSNEVTSLVLDKDQNLWIGTSNGIDVLNKNRTQILKFAGQEKFPSHIIDALSVDCFGNIWFGGLDDGFGCIYRDNRNRYHVKSLRAGIGLCILADSHQPVLTVSSAKGLNRFIIDKNGNILKNYHYSIGNGSAAASLSSNYTYPIKKGDDSTYWIGTIGGGLDRLRLGANNRATIKWYGRKQGVFNDVETIELDAKGNLWMGGNGLEKFSHLSSSITKFDKNDGLQGTSFKVGASLKGKDGRLYFGGIDGLNYFYPDSITKNKIPATPAITDFIINDNSSIASRQNQENALSTAITKIKEIRLRHDQNYFIISFSSLHYANALKCRYRYRLEGFDNEWKYTDGRNPSATYANLDYKDYRFVVQGTNNDGIWGRTEAVLFIDVAPPWWYSGIAKFVYILLIFSVLIAIYVYQRRFYRLENEIALKNIEQRNQEEIHRHKEELFQQQVQFFTNISHEFRTPLTLIMGPLERMIKYHDGSELSQSYSLMYRNAKRLVNLISELMNFRKVADSMIKLTVEKISVAHFVKETSDEFRELAIKKRIDFVVKDTVDDVSNWFDPPIVEKILFNLLNNAFKYTQEGGTVTLEVFHDFDSFEPLYKKGFQILNEYRANRYIFFRIADTGVGISEDSIELIFDRFYRVSNTQLGSGVGLALVKSLTVLHKGDIFVYSERNKGTEIIIGLPFGELNYSDEERKSYTAKKAEVSLEKIDINSVALQIEGGDDDPVGFELNKKNTLGKNILIAEDNRELRLFLKSVLVEHYNIYEAEDGVQAYELAVSLIPDLIISDIMMPNMDGIELCRVIKVNLLTSHIPFMLLTAKDSLESKIEGLEYGADYYFSKPFSTNLLLLTIHNIFEQRSKLIVKYKKDYYADASELTSSKKDKEFIDKLLLVIEQNIEEPELDVDFLCRQLFISRTKLYQKIKGISGQSVGEFIRTVRLKKAAHIMTNEDVTLNDVVYRIGLISNSYFSRAFKKEFGQSPSEFLKSLKNQKSSAS
ncbi:response regulator [Mucilaginibacter sp. Mucisp86]|uniref:hybrid sensor histidine kinase/response regulator transcription factor n=1 Tax=Mucilaginibacter sp. Mucisp86 TaxID=3243060 RepID=UPI0039B3DA7E